MAIPVSSEFISQLFTFCNLWLFTGYLISRWVCYWRMAYYGRSPDTVLWSSVHGPSHSPTLFSC